MNFKKIANKFLVRMISPKEYFDEEEMKNGKKKILRGRVRSVVKPSGKFKDVRRAFEKKVGRGLQNGSLLEEFEIRFPFFSKRQLRREDEEEDDE